MFPLRIDLSPLHRLALEAAWWDGFRTGAVAACIALLVLAALRRD